MEDLCLIVASFFALRLTEVLGYEPAFDVPIVNVTVVTGQTAVLPCSIEYLGKYKVAWLDSKSIPLTYEDRRVIDDFRFSVVRPYSKEWNLQIRDIKREDQGQYRCTINTNPVKSKLVMLHVKVPASIIDSLSSNDMTIQEGDTVVLVCNVTGVPRPEVTWSRRSGNSDLSDGESNKCAIRGSKGPGKDITGEMIVLQNVSRHCDDIYECIASNGVPPAVSRLIKVTVEFKPEVTLPNLRQSQSRGRETILDCIITANPQATSMWRKDGRSLLKSAKHLVEAYEEGENVLSLNLRIKDIEAIDYGDYECYAKNSLGDASKTMLLYEYVDVETKFRTTNQSRVPTTTLFPVLQFQTVARNQSAATPIGTKRFGHGIPSQKKHLSGMMSQSSSQELSPKVPQKWFFTLIGFFLATVERAIFDGL